MRGSNRLGACTGSAGRGLLPTDGVMPTRAGTPGAAPTASITPTTAAAATTEALTMPARRTRTAWAPADGPADIRPRWWCSLLASCSSAHAAGTQPWQAPPCSPAAWSTSGRPPCPAASTRRSALMALAVSLFTVPVEQSRTWADCRRSGRSRSAAPGRRVPGGNAATAPQVQHRIMVHLTGRPIGHPAGQAYPPRPAGSAFVDELVDQDSPHVGVDMMSCLALSQCT